MVRALHSASRADLPCQAYYPSTADITPRRSPDLPASFPPPSVPSISRNNHLALPELRSVTSRIEEHEGASGSSITSESPSSGSGVTYRFPTAVDARVVPAWATEGLGSSEVRAESSIASSPRSVRRGMGVSDSPLPPGAAPPNPTNEPDRIVDTQ
jgi:hypothetical protein